MDKINYNHMLNHRTEEQARLDDVQYLEQVLAVKSDLSYKSAFKLGIIIERCEVTTDVLPKLKELYPQWYHAILDGIIAGDDYAKSRTHNQSYY